MDTRVSARLRQRSARPDLWLTTIGGALLALGACAPPTFAQQVATAAAQTPSQTSAQATQTSASATQAPAEEAQPLDPNLRAIDFGGRFTSVDGDEARFERYRDLRSGPVIPRFRFTTERETWLFAAAADNVGYRDQHYGADFEWFGRLGVRFDWDQIPLFISQTTRTLYTTAAPGVLRLDDGIQQAIQNGTLSLADASLAATRFDVRNRRDRAQVDLVYRVPHDIDTHVDVTTTKREGTQPWGATFGFANDVEVAVPIDTRTTDISTGLEWSHAGRLLRVGYDASWFDNKMPSLIWDNPLRATDSPTAPAQARTALWPDSNTQTVSGTASMPLPLRSRVTAYLSRGVWNQNDTLLPHTINSAIASPPLARSTAEAEAVVTAMMARATSRPRNWVWLNVSYRRYDFDNRTPPLLTPQIVSYDSALATSTEGATQALSFTRGLFEAEASFTPWRNGALKVGYSREAVDRTFRLFETTVEHTGKVSYDLTSLTWLTLRAQYLHAKRTGQGLDEEALSDIGEQVSLRQFDISDRIRNQGTLMLLVMPTSMVSLNVSAGGGKDDRPDAQFGLTDTTFQVYTAGIDVTPREGVTFGVNGGYERYTSLQNSRQANPGPQFDDPTRNWSTDGAERVTSAGANAQFAEIAPRTRLSLAYDYNRSRSRYLYLLTPDTTLPPVTQLPGLKNDWTRASADLAYAIRRNLSIGLRYEYDRLRLDDFALGASTIDRLVFPSTLLLGYYYRPYTAHVATVKMTYLW
jgi:MtrB/PioB family decaheme-associated outer membrane protein